MRFIAEYAWVAFVFFWLGFGLSLLLRGTDGTPEQEAAELDEQARYLARWREGRR